MPSTNRYSDATNDVLVEMAEHESLSLRMNSRPDLADFIEELGRRIKNLSGMFHQ